MSEPLTDFPRDEMNLEASLKAVLTQQPDPAFVDALEQRLLANQHVAPASTVERRKSLLRRWRNWWVGTSQTAPRLRWAAVPITVLALVLVALLVIGPERAWAGLQAWLGYVPGIGFVDLDESRLLAKPERVTREGVTLQVVNVVAGPEDTVVVVEIEGLPPEDRFQPREMPPSTETQPVLRLPSGEALTATGVSASRARATFVFPPLPAAVYHVTLELARLPLLTEGAAPEEWAVALFLQPATGELVAEMYPQPYRPAGATETHHGVTFSVLEVAHHPEETALQMELTWENPAWENHVGFGGDLPFLLDKNGNKYLRIPGSTSGSQVWTEARPVGPGEPTPARNTLVSSETFEPVPPGTQQLTIVVDGFDFEMPAEGSFTIDLGEDPQPGDSWDLDVTLEVAEFPVHITRVEAVEEEVGPRNNRRQRIALHFTVDQVAAEGDRVLLGFLLAAPEAGFSGSGRYYMPATNTITASLAVDEGASLPGGLIQINLESASVFIKGPWELSWQVPGNADTAASRTTLTQSYTPPDAGTTQAGVTLSVLTAAHGEGETALQVRVHWHEPGRSFNGLWGAEPRLRDEQGTQYDRSWSASQPLRVTVEARNPAVTPSPPPGGYTQEMMLLFAPVPASVETLALEVEALSFHENASGELHLDLGPAPRVGQRWSLDETWTTGDSPVHVRGVQLLRSDDLGLPYQLVFEMDVAPQDDGADLIGLLLEADLDYFGSTSGNIQLQGVLAPALLLPAIPDRPFTVRADAASLVVEGPWEVKWTVPR